MKKIGIAVLVVLMILNSMAFSFADTGKEPIIEAKAAVLIDASTGEVLFDKNMNQKMYPASTTKIMTALLVLENLKLSQVVTVDKETALTGGSQINLIEGEKITVEQLLYALLLKSANDAAVALAKEVSGSVPQFAELMNARSKELGAQNTHFVTPNGLPNDNHYTSAYDLAMIAKGAMQNQEFRKLVTTLKYTIPKTNKSGARELNNPNKLLYSKAKISVNGVLRPFKYKGATGIKNGYTDEAGRCLVASAKRGDRELISVVLNTSADGKFADSIALLDYGFDNYRRELAIKKGESIGNIKVVKGAVRSVDVVAAKSAYVSVFGEETEASNVSSKTVMDHEIKAPIAKGQKVGKVEIYKGDDLVDQVDAVVAKSVNEGGFLSTFGIPDWAAHIVFGVIAIFAVLGILGKIAARNRNRRRRRRRKSR